MKAIAIGLLGAGNVGGGVVRILEQNRESIERRLGASVRVKRVLVRDVTRLDEAELASLYEQAVDAAGAECQFNQRGSCLAGISLAPVRFAEPVAELGRFRLARVVEQEMATARALVAGGVAPEPCLPLRRSTQTQVKPIAFAGAMSW